MMRLDSMTPCLMQGHIPQLNLSFSLTPKVLKAPIHTRHAYCRKVAGLLRHDFKSISAFDSALLTQSIKICEIKKSV